MTRKSFRKIIFYLFYLFLKVMQLVTWRWDLRVILLGCLQPFYVKNLNIFYKNKLLHNNKNRN